MLLYYITDRAQFGGDESARRSALLQRIRAAASAGVDYIQLRERDLPARELESLARDAVRATAGTSAKLLINHRTDVAIAAGAAGAHLRSGPQEISVADARALYVKSGNARPVIAVSCHSREEVAEAENGGADFVVFGPVFGKKDSPGADGRGIEELREICASVKIPVLALGGVNLENAQECLRAGAAGVAGIRVFQDRDIARTIKTLRASN